MLLSACGGGGGGSNSGSGGGSPVVAPIIKITPSPSPSASPAPGATSTANPTAFTCPNSDAASTTAFARGGGSTELSMHHRVNHASKAKASATTLLAVTYSRGAMTDSNTRLIAGREQAAGGTLLHSFDYPRLNMTQRIVAVPTATLAKSEALLHYAAGVQSIGLAGQRRSRTTSSSLVTNDPYFVGFAGSSGPYHETASIPGEWDMYAIGLDHAFGYSVATANTSPRGAVAAALGSSAIKIAIIDTGEDTNHPELAGKIVYQKCFITNPNTSVPSTGNFTTDEDGHGTDVAGIAAAANANGLGFTGAGGKSVIYGYRVFPTPDDNCSNTASDDTQCSTDTNDIVSAINDAVAQHVNVISMSLGGGGCDSSGNDSDSGEGTAVRNAIAAGIIVVAAAGNDASPSAGVTAPGCDTGVIAVGATSLDDGTATATTGNYTTTLVAGATSASPKEYVASYSQYGSPGASLHNSSAWGIVAPGGDPADAETTSTGTPNDLHWIEHIWTTTPFGGQGDANFAGSCSADFNSNSVTDCRTLIAGTSMSTPHVAGAAALILAVNPAYSTPAAMKALLCSTADDLGDSHQGCGRLNVYRAMATALSDPTPP